MIVISGTIAVKPEERENWLEAAAAMSRASEAEAGCQTYRFYADLEDPNRFLLFEVWDSEEALEAHFQTEHIAEYRAATRPLLAQPSNITRFEVSQARPL